MMSLRFCQLYELAKEGRIRVTPILRVELNRYFFTVAYIILVAVTVGLFASKHFVLTVGTLAVIMVLAVFRYAGIRLVTRRDMMTEEEYRQHFKEDFRNLLRSTIFNVPRNRKSLEFNFESPVETREGMVTGILETMDLVIEYWRIINVERVDADTLTKVHNVMVNGRVWVGTAEQRFDGP